jgi:pimeloyl-ACP methyl ester carboxylesterase
MTFVLVHGGGFGGSCWEPLIPFLDADAHAVDLPGRGTRPADLATVTVTVADFADAVAGEIVERDLHDVVLVGHSLAGITLPGVMARVGERLRHVVFVSCAIPPEGVAVADVLGSFGPQLAEVATRLGDAVLDGNGLLHPDLAAALFCNDMDDAQRALTLELLVPEALGVISEPTDLRGLAGPVPRTYVRLLRDASLDLDAQTRMAAELGDADIFDLDAGHMAMISRPAELAAILNAV